MGPAIIEPKERTGRQRISCLFVLLALRELESVLLYGGSRIIVPLRHRLTDGLRQPAGNNRKYQVISPGAR